MAGRRPKPTHLKVVSGNPGKRKLNDKEPTPAREIPSPPAHLTDWGKVAWGRLTVLLDGMGVLTVADTLALERLKKHALKFMPLPRRKTRQWSFSVMLSRWWINLQLFPHVFRNQVAPERNGTWLFFSLAPSFVQLVQMTGSPARAHIALLSMKFTSIKAIRLLK